ncbi:MAG: hypothetical protein Q4D79_13990 [Propionibacteriaceae bacterium]|nr:hypothetical protein [Propionibacteriaceae bacterium]
MSRRFTVTAERSGGVWVLESNNGAVNQIRRLSQAAEEMREAVAYLAGLDAGDVELAVRPILPESYWAAARRAERLREEAHRMQR